MRSNDMTIRKGAANAAEAERPVKEHKHARTGSIALTTVTLIATLMVPEMAWAAEGGIFDTISKVLEKVATDLTGSGWLTWIGVIAIAIGGVLFAVGELSGPFGYVIRVVAGLAVAAGAVALGASLTGGGGPTAMYNAQPAHMAHSGHAGSLALTG